MRRTVLVLTTAVVCAIAAACADDHSGNGQLGAEGESTVSPEQIAQLENELRSKPSFETAKAEYHAAIDTMADDIAALIPGLSWHIDKNSWGGCSGPYAHTRGKRVAQRIVFTGPIPDGFWSQALQIVKDGAARFGATHVGTFHDQPGFHHGYISGPDGIDFELVTQVQAVLSAKSDCRISETVTPSPTPER